MFETAGPKGLPFVSIVVPALNCANDVAGFADAIRRQDYPTERYEVIVVDNGSTDDTFESLRAFGLTALKRNERGRARALNAGVKAARGEFILTTDLSCRPEPYWIRAVVAAFAAHPEAGCVAGEIKLLETDDNVALRFQQRTNYMSPLLALGRTKLPFMPFADGANASFRKQVFDDIGGFEESFVKAADVEICCRMFVLTNYALVFNPAALIWEPGEPSLRALLHQRFRMGIGWNLMSMKYPALYESPQQGAGVRRIWWRLRGGFATALRIFVLNLGAIVDHKRDAAVDANIWQLMSWFQWCGRHYGRWWLDRHGIRPVAVSDTQLRRVMADADRIRTRVIVMNTATGCTP